MKYISSLQNSLVKNIVLLKEKSKERKKQGLFVLEGIRELKLAIKGNYEITSLLFCAELIALDGVNQIIDNQNVELIEVSKKIYQKLAFRTTTEGIVAILKIKKFDLKSIQLNKNSLILVAEAPEKPGNIGALLRTADAANIDAIFIANPLTDMFNPNIIRSSIGCLFTKQIAIGNTSEIIDYLKTKNIQLFAAALHNDSQTYLNQDYSKSSAIIVGTESTGLSNQWLKNATKIIIPMQGEIDSLNVSVSAAVILFEAIRQRGNSLLR